MSDRLEKYIESVKSDLCFIDKFIGVVFWIAILFVAASVLVLVGGLL